ncbi:fliW family protein [Clostridium argentinense CDC 2741]|uniref:Flagellar assembly factor FliW n=1 Tax=Clostridium argentinense CDC 2741 TaxID=1418104 RepID=A0A0C1U5W9_9CLOT|nr:flagellar assembly protein FliW [Clostridium argentinense]ARC85335.1 flagellar assembly protein FliW [Clostridium argentinense]KIE47158.1 fliW family protein [Clostridium argentinense CDC 2741]NFF41498.1 flagellar assembly protein FliW [Clostridium argentinense]NFP52060.1 flagellar assembly protein FliW [Clostridium argentinense]NFP73526.1 flagellar assembly protein FliW [Clostridium argentinense]
MELNSKHHGVVNYSEEDIIFFKNGLPGFEDLKKFIVFPLKDNDNFSIIHSIEEDLGIILISPFMVKEDYEFKLEENILEELKIKEPNEVMVYTTVTLNSNIEKITTNLKAPIVINRFSKLGKQIIIDNESYKIKEPIFKEK